MASGTIPFPMYAIYFTTGYDLNNPPDHFCFLNVNENTENTPSQVSGSSKRGLVISYPYGTGAQYAGQLFLSEVNTNAYVFVRAKYGSTWGEWKQLAFVS